MIAKSLLAGLVIVTSTQGDAWVACLFIYVKDPQSLKDEAGLWYEIPFQNRVPRWGD